MRGLLDVSERTVSGSLRGLLGVSERTVRVSETTVRGQWEDWGPVRGLLGVSESVGGLGSVR